VDDVPRGVAVTPLSPQQADQLPDGIVRLMERLYTGAHRDFAPTSQALNLSTSPAAPPLPELIVSAEGAAGRWLLDRLPFGLVAVDACRRVRFENAIGKRMLDARDPIVREGCLVRPWSAEDSMAFSALAEAACVAASWPQDGRDIVISRRAPPGTTVRLIGFRLGDPPNVALVLLLPDEEREHALRRLLMTMFALTPAESHVVRLMIRGTSLEDVARRRGVTMKAVRAQWYTARSKIGNGGDAQLLQTLRAALLLPLAYRVGGDEQH